MATSSNVDQLPPLHNYATKVLPIEDPLMSARILSPPVATRLAPIFAPKRFIRETDPSNDDLASGDVPILPISRRPKKQFSLPNGLKEFSVLKCVEQYFYHELYVDGVMVDESVKSDDLKCIQKVMKYTTELAKRSQIGRDTLEAVKAKDTDTTDPNHIDSEEKRGRAYEALVNILFDHIRMEEFKHFPNIFVKNPKATFDSLESLSHIDNYMYYTPSQSTVTATAKRIKNLIPKNKAYQTQKNIRADKYRAHVAWVETKILMNSW
jgi:hypothetical protein